MEQSWRHHFDLDVRTVIEQVINRYDPEKIILFGSVSRGDFHEDSDVDLLIVKQTERRFIERISDVLSLIDVNIPVEPLVYTPDEIIRLQAEKRDFILTILEEGKIVYERANRPEPWAVQTLV